MSYSGVYLFFCHTWKGENKMGNKRNPPRYKKGLLLTKDNNFIRIHGNMTPMSYKLVNFFLWAAIKEHRLENLQANAADLARLLSIGDHSFGKVFKEECKKASETSIEIQDKFDPDEKWKFMPLITLMEYDHGTLTTTINPKILPYIKDLSSNYTPVELKTLSSCGSYPSMRLYEVCLSWRRAGQVTYSVEEWRGLLGAAKKTYDSFSQFKRRIWMPAIEGVNHRTNIRVTDEFVKEGRTVKEITVYIKEVKTIDAVADDVPLSLDTYEDVSKPAAQKGKETPAMPETVMDMIALGFDVKTASTYYEKFGEAYCRAQVDFVVEMSKKGRIKNTAGYLRRAMDGDFAGERERAREAERREREWQRAKEQEKRELVEGGIFGERVATEGVESVGDIAKSIVRETKPSEPTDAPTMPPADEKAAGYWQAILGIAKSPLYGLSTLVVEHWLTPCVPVSVDGGTLSIVAPNDFAKRMIVSEYLATLKKAAAAMGISDVVCTAVS